MEITSLTNMIVRVKMGHLVTKTSEIPVYFCKCSSNTVLERECPMPKSWVFYYCELIVPAKIVVYSTFISDLHKDLHNSHKHIVHTHCMDSPLFTCYTDFQKIGTVPVSCLCSIVYPYSLKNGEGTPNKCRIYASTSAISCDIRQSPTCENKFHYLLRTSLHLFTD